MGITDEQLVSQARNGSEVAYREIVRRFERPVYNLVVRMVRDAALAEDLSQDAFLKAFDRLDTYRAGQGKFSNWLFKIAHNTTIDHLRRASLDTIPLDAADADEPDFHAVLSDPGADTPYDAALRSDLAGALRAAIDRLRPEYREAIVLRHQEGLAYEEVAEVTGLPLGTVKTYLHRARKELAEHLTEAGWGPGAAAPTGGRETSGLEPS